MTRLSTGKKPKKKQSEFQQLWVKAERFKQENARFRERLDEIIQRIRTDIAPVEKTTAGQQIPVLKRLLALGQRKSLTQWQRQTLDDWIREIMDPLQGTEYFNDDILEELCRYDAFRLGIELDETSSTPLSDQLRAYFDQQQIQSQEDEDEDEDAWEQATLREIEQILDQTFGPEPPMPEHQDQNENDLFKDELKAEQQRQYEAYIEARNAAREELLEEMFGAGEFFDDDDDEDGDFFDFGADPFGSNAAFSEQDKSEAPAISNVVFKQLFRSIAAQLHPDREHDAARREEKHSLMTKLLDARKQGDVMTIVQMYQEHVGDDAGLSAMDEKQLINALKMQIDELQSEQEKYSFESPLHRLAYQRFYFPSAAKTDRVFKQHLQQLEITASEAQSLALSLKTLKALKPYLEERYEEQFFYRPMEAFDEFFDFSR